MSKRLAFVLEYALGHATHADNLKRAVASGDCGALHDPLYLDIAFGAKFGAWATVPPFRSNWTLRASLAALLALRRYRGADIAATLFHTQVTAQFAHGYMARTPSVVSLDATSVQMDALGKWYDHAAGSPAAERFKKRLTQKTFGAARRLVAWSQWTKDSLVADYAVAPDKIVVIPPGIALDRWDFDARRRVKDADETLDLLFVGGDFVRKGGDTFLAAWRGLAPATRKKAHLHLVTKQAPLLSTSDENVTTYFDIVPNDARLLDLFARADLFVFPTRADCLPLAVMEALAAGVPVITTAVAALPEAVVNGANGAIVPVGDADALGAAITDLCADAPRRVRMGHAARDFARERFDARTNYRRLVETVREVAA